MNMGTGLRRIPGGVLDAVSLGMAACAVGLFAVSGWRLMPARPDQAEVRASSRAAQVLDEGRAVCASISREVDPAIRRTKLAAKDAGVVAALASGDADRLTKACNDVLTHSTEIDAVALFGPDGRILAINNVYGDGKPIAPERVRRIMDMNFSGRDIIQACVRNSADADVLEFQTHCDITPAFFDSTGLSVAYSTPVHDPATGKRIGVISSRMLFTRLESIIRGRSFGQQGRSAEFVTDAGEYFSEEINSKQRAAPIPPPELAKLVLPLVEGRTDLALTHVGDKYIGLFRLKEFQTLAGGGIQLMLLLSDDFISGQFTQARRESAAWWFGGGVAVLSLAAFTRVVRRMGESERRNRTLVDTAMDGVVMLDGAGVVMSWNPAAERSLGASAAEAIGKPLRSIVELAATDSAGAVSITSLADATARQGSCEVRAKCSNGRELVLDVAAVELGGSHGESHSLFLRDVTERKALEQRLSQAQKLESIGQLAAGIAHEINTPVQYVSDNVRFLKEQFGLVLGVSEAAKAVLQEPGDEALRNRLEAEAGGVDLEFAMTEVPLAIDQSLEGLDRVAAIVRAMKEFSHPGSAMMDPADINQAVRSTAMVCTNRWKTAARVHFDLDPDLPRVRCLVAEINQVLLNLIVNAADAIGETCKATGQLGNITVRTRRVDESVEIRVEDDGPGMTEAVQRRLFEPFFTTKAMGKGTGQGLAISRTVIEKKHGGTLRFESTHGRGTTFVVVLPIGREMDEAHQGPGKEAA